MRPAPDVSLRSLLRLLPALVLLLAGCARESADSGGRDTVAEAADATFVGREVCAPCHREQEAGWWGSHHDLAMQEATAETVLGDFSGATLTYAGVTSTFFRRDGGFWVETDGPDGDLGEYQIAYAFGVEPLQQYLVGFPDGRYQALSVVWDARPGDQGGQRWYHLYPGEAVDHEDPLHWTGVYQNWNQQCAECHSTNLVKGCDPATDSYRTTWSEIDVSCEACHGPGSRHAGWAQKVEVGEVVGDGPNGLVVDLRDKSGGVWEINAATGIAERSSPPGTRAEIEACGRCHARRSPIVADYEYGRPLLDTHRLSLLEENLYWADGHIRDEVYVYGSFVQSKMYRAGVSCGDCHDPHRLAIASPDEACARCHLPAKFADPSHHFHPAGSTGASCVECHMPARVYMGVDSRRDHGFRIPRPDLSAILGTPNPCSDCHQDRSVEWVAEAFGTQYGDVSARRPHFSAALAAGRRGLPEARRLLADLVRDREMPAIARGSGFELFRSAPWLLDPDALRQGLADPDPLVRMGAARGAEALAPERRLELLAPLLDDPIRAVRIEAGRALAPLAGQDFPPAVRGPLDLALAEYVDSQRVNGDRPDAQLNLGLVYAQQGLADAAEDAYRRSLDLDSRFAPAYVNLADLFRATGRDGEGEELLRRAAELLPENAGVRHSLGLALIRRGQTAAALGELQLAAELPPRPARYSYVYGVALHSTGETDRALEVLAEAQERHPGDPDLLTALATISRDAGRSEAARQWAEKLLAFRPEDPAVRRLAAELRGSPSS